MDHLYDDLNKFGAFLFGIFLFWLFGKFLMWDMKRKGEDIE